MNIVNIDNPYQSPERKLNKAYASELGLPYNYISLIKLLNVPVFLLLRRMKE